MRVVMMGTGPFAVPSFRALYGSRHEVLALVTQPLRPAVGNKPPPPSPMRRVAQEHGTPIFDPPSVNTPEARQMLTELRPDLFVVADYGQILTVETLALAPLGGINLHGSLLPRYRGAAPINWAVFNGDAETGVTVIHMTPRIDAGPAIAKAVTPIGPDENALELEHRLAELGAPLVVETLDRLAVGPVESLVQDASLRSPARRLRKTDGEVEWQRHATAIRNQVRALEPWPRTSTSWLRPEQPPLRLILGQVSVAAADGTAPAETPPGTVVAADSTGIVVATGGGLLVIERLQPAGKRMMTAGEFLLGYRMAAGELLGPETVAGG